MVDPDTRGIGSGHTSALRVRAARVEIQSGVDAGKTARIDRPYFVIGSGERADLRLTDETVSREHLRLTLEPSGVHVRDEASKNGTWIGELRVRDALISGDTSLRLGAAVAILRIEGAEMALPLSERDQFGQALGRSPAMRYLFSILERAAMSEVTVLLEGESGVGKEILARAVHDESPRRHGPFVTVDCSAIPASLIESELFGHERGAFTGADRARQGLFEHANGGTLFLDEVGELPLDLQPKLLRVLEQREVRPVGSQAVRPIDVRVVAATNRPLAESSARGEFRRDLFYRLAVARVVVPPLRERPEDIVIIARSFLRAVTGDQAAELAPDLAGLLANYDWPGNVRELRNVIERHVFLGVRDSSRLFDSAKGALQGPEDLAALPYHEARRLTLERLDRYYLPKVLERAGGVVARAADLAQLARPSIYRMMDRAGIPRDKIDRE